VGGTFFTLVDWHLFWQRVFMKEKKIVGPFKQVVTMDKMSLTGALCDKDLHIIEDAGVLVSEGRIQEIKSWKKLEKEKGFEKEIVGKNCVLLPGLIDSHTHMCYAGSRVRDYALRTAGVSYLEIAKQGGGILDTVKKTREASEEELEQKLTERARLHLNQGVTTSEVKSGYGLNVDDELKMLRVINSVDNDQAMDLVPTCLGAHTLPPEFVDHKKYLSYLVQELLPKVKEAGLSKRVDIFVEEGAFCVNDAKEYLEKAKDMGFEIVIHADQFSTGASSLASDIGALSAEHLEASTDKEIELLAKNNIVANVLPGASLGLGMGFAPARKLLDQGCSVVISSDWNPGSAPMGNLLTQAAILGAYEKLSAAEVLAGITYRAAHVLQCGDRGILKKGLLADMIAFPCADYRSILYRQGQIKPAFVWKKGNREK